MPIDYSHQHLSTAIMQVDAPHTPIEPGGGVTVTVPPTDPVAVTNFNLPGATIADGTATLLATQLIGPFTVNFNTTDIGDGAFLADIPAGSIVVKTWPVVDTGFDDAALLAIALGSQDFGPPDDDWSQLGLFDVSGATGSLPNYQISAPELAMANAGPPYIAVARVGVALTDSVLVAYIGQAPTMGSCRVYAIIATPAS